MKQGGTCNTPAPERVFSDTRTHQPLLLCGSVNLFSTVTRDMHDCRMNRRSKAETSPEHITMPTVCPPSNEEHVNAKRSRQKQPLVHSEAG